MILHSIVDFDTNVAKLAAELGVQHGLPLAGSVIYATARTRDATLWTLDTDLEGLPGVEVLARDRG